MAAPGIGGTPSLGPYYTVYQDPTALPISSAWASRFNQFDIVANTGPTAVRDAVVLAATARREFISVLVHCRSDTALADDPGRILAYHRVISVPSGFDPPKPWHDQVLVFCGDVEGTQVPASLVVPLTAFHRSTANNTFLQVPTAASHVQLMAGAPDSSFFGPFAAGDPDTEAVTVRRVMYCPNPYVSLFGEAGLSPRDAYERVTARITADGLGNDLAVLERWLRATCVRHGSATDPASTAIPYLAPVQVPLPADSRAFLSERQAQVYLDLPDLSPASRTAGHAGIIDGMRDATEEIRLARTEAADRAAKAASKTVDQHLGPLTTHLLRLAAVSDTSALPPIWQEIANKPKMSRRLLQDRVSAALQTFGYHISLVVTPAMDLKITSLDWGVTQSQEDDFSVGLHPLCLGPFGTTESQAALMMAQQADLVTTGTNSGTLADARALITPKGDVALPATWADLLAASQRWHALLSVLLPSNHVMVLRAYDFQRTLTSQLQGLLRAPPQPFFGYPTSLGPALAARDMQLQLVQYFHLQSGSNAPIPAPDLCRLFSTLRGKKEAWHPTFPSHYLTRAAPAPPASPAIDRSPGAAAAPASAQASTGRSGTSTTDPWEGVYHDPDGRICRAPNLRDRFKSLLPTPAPLAKEVKTRWRNENTVLPKNSHGDELCPTIFATETCNNNCVFERAARSRGRSVHRPVVENKFSSTTADEMATFITAEWRV